MRRCSLLALAIKKTIILIIINNLVAISNHVHISIVTNSQHLHEFELKTNNFNISITFKS